MPESTASSTLIALTDAFLECSLPRERWTHAAHLAVGLVLFLRHGEDWAFERLRHAIPRYNRLTGRTPRERDGYDDAITRRYVAAIAEHVAANPSDDPAELFAELSSGPLGRHLRTTERSAG